MGATYSPVEVFRRFRGFYCFYPQDGYSYTKGFLTDWTQAKNACRGTLNVCVLSCVRESDTDGAILCGDFGECF